MAFLDDLQENNIQIYDFGTLMDAINNAGEGTVFVSVDNPNIELSASYFGDLTVINSIEYGEPNDLYVVSGSEISGSIENVYSYIQENFSNGYVVEADIEDIDIDNYRLLTNGEDIVPPEGIEYEYHNEQYEDNSISDEIINEVNEIRAEESRPLDIGENISSPEEMTLINLEELNYDDIYEERMEEFADVLTEEVNIEDSGIYDFPFDEIDKMDEMEVDDNSDSTDDNKKAVNDAIDQKNSIKIELTEQTDKLSSRLVETYKTAIFEHGYIPPLMRDGGKIRDVTITTENVAKIRETAPDFGKMFGGTVDTTKGYSVKIDIEQIKPYLKEDIPNLESCRLYVNPGDTYKISINGTSDSINFRPVNVYTFNFSTDKGFHSQAVLVGDELGNIYRELTVMGDNVPMDISKNYEFLDRTSIDNPNHFKRLEAPERDEKGKIVYEENPKTGKGYVKRAVDNEGNPVFIPENERISIREILEDASSDVLGQVCDKMVDKLIEERPIIEEKSNIAADIEKNIRNIYDNSEFLKEYYGSRIESKREELGSIEDKILDTLKNMDNEDKKSSTYKELNNKLEVYKGEYKEKVEELKTFVKSCDIGNDTKVSYTELAKTASDNKSIFEKSLDIKESYGNYKDAVYSDDVSKDSKGVNINKEVSSDVRFLQLTEFNQIKPSDKQLDIDKLSNTRSEAAINKKEELVDSWNSKPEHEFLQLSLDKDTGEIWTQYGTKVEIEKVKGETPEFNYEKLKNSVTEGVFSKDILPPTMKDGKVDSESKEEFLDKKVEGTEIRIRDIGKVFVETELRTGYSSEKIDRVEKIQDLENGFNSKVDNAGLSKDTVNKLSDIKSFLNKESKFEVKQIEELDKADSKNSKPDKDKTDFDSLVRKAHDNAFGKINAENKIELSKDKIESLKNEAKSMADSVYKEKYNESIDKIQKQADKIVKIYNKMEKYENFPPMFKNSNTFYSKLKLSFDEALREYVKLGGSVGKDSFCTKAPTRMELLSETISFFRSNIIETAILEVAFRISEVWDKKDLEKKEDSTDIDKKDNIEKPTEDVEGKPTNDIDGEPTNDIEAKPTEDVEEKPTDDVEEKPTDVVEEKPTEDVEEKPTDDVEEKPTDDVEEKPTDDVEEKPTDDVEEETTDDVEEKPTDDVEEKPTDDVEEKPTDDVEEKPTDDVEEKPTDDVEEKPTDDVEEEPTDDVEEKPTDDVEEKPTDDVEEKPTDDVEEKPTDDVEEKPTDDVEEEPTDDVEEKPTDDVEEPTNDIEERPSDDTDEKIEKDIKDDALASNSEVESVDINEPEEDSIYTTNNAVDESPDSFDEAKNWSDEIKEKLNDYYNNNDDFKDTITDALSDGFGTDDLINTICESILDNSDNISNTEDYINATADIVNFASDTIDGVPSDIRDEIFSGLENLGMTDFFIERFEVQVAEKMENSDTEFTNTAFGMLDNIPFDELDIIDEGISINEPMDITTNDIESAVAEDINSPEFQEQIAQDVSDMETVDSIKNDLIDNGMEPSMANDMVEAKVEQDLNNNIDIHDENYPETIETTIQDTVSSQDTPDLSVDNMELPQDNFDQPFDIDDTTGFSE